VASDQPDRRSPIVGDLRLRAGDPPRLADEAVGVLVELNTSFPGGIERALAQFLEAFTRLTVRRASNRPVPHEVTPRLYKCTLTRRQIAELVALDQRTEPHHEASIFRIWPDYELTPQIDRSAPTVKADVAWRAFHAEGKGVVWAVIDSGVDRTHPHFSELELFRETTSDVHDRPCTGGLHRDFSYLAVNDGQPADTDDPLTDPDGHGTHVAGIIAGRCPEDKVPNVASSNELVGQTGYVPRPHGRLCGMAPSCELISLKVMRENAAGNLVTTFAAVIAALEYVRSELNVNRAALRVHGVNLSLGCAWDPTHYAAGQSPLCKAVNDLVDSGVVVVVSAGNGGGMGSQTEARQSVSVLGSVTEPAHAEACIAVGSTHREAPHTFGVSWTSGKGPTLDGRAKPDVIAPGEWIASAATGSVRSGAGFPSRLRNKLLTYAELSGTSMAAPHASGVIAGFLSARPEFIGRPREVKELVLGTATDIGRERYAQGAGVIDALRLLSQS
jgi:subtilisin family serine protease